MLKFKNRDGKTVIKENTETGELQILAEELKGIEKDKQQLESDDADDKPEDEASN